VDVPGAQAWSRRLRMMPEPIVRNVAKLIARMKTGKAGDIPPQTRWGKLADVLATRGDLLKLYQLSYALYTPAFLRELRADCDGDVEFGLTKRDCDALRTEIKRMPALCAISRLELESFITQRLLRDTDCASMAVSLEARVPLLDHRVVEEADRLDPRVRYQPLGRKQLLRELAMPELEASMFDRPKAGFVLPIERWARQALHGQMNEMLTDRSACESVGLNGDAVSRLWRAYGAGAPGLYWSRVWAIYVLLWWRRAHDVSL
jgi:asparagine synthase (glutamine-hydrolysing)